MGPELLYRRDVPSVCAFPRPSRSLPSVCAMWVQALDARALRWQGIVWQGCPYQQYQPCIKVTESLPISLARLRMPSWRTAVVGYAPHLEVVLMHSRFCTKPRPKRLKLSKPLGTSNFPRIARKSRDHSVFTSSKIEQTGGPSCWLQKF